MSEYEKGVEDGYKAGKEDLTMIEKRNAALLQILNDIFYKTDFCCLCGAKGKYLPDCDVCEADKCINELVRLYEKES